MTRRDRQSETEEARERERGGGGGGGALARVDSPIHRPAGGEEKKRVVERGRELERELYTCIDRPLPLPASARQAALGD